MALSYSPSKAVYIGNGVTVDFPFDFKVWKDTNLEVSIISPHGVVEVVTGWTAKITDRGGTVTYRKDGAPLPTGWKLAVLRNMPFEQDVDLVSGTRFDPQVIEDQLDKAAAERQQLREGLERAVRVPPSSEETGENLLESIYAARGAAQYAATEAEASQIKAQGAASDAHGAADAAHASEVAAGEHEEEARLWAERAENANNSGPAKPDHLGNVIPRKGLTVDEEGVLDVHVGAGLDVESQGNCLRVNASTVDNGVLPVQHGGTGASDVKGVLGNLGLADWMHTVATTNPQRLRNAVLAGREKDGYPAYLVGPEFLNMEHEDGVYISKRGMVTTSGEYSAAYRATKPLRNQVVFQSNGWLTPNTVTKGWWQYDFADRAHVLCALFMQGGHTDSSPTYTLRTWQLLGWNEDSLQWEEITRRDADQSQRGYTNNLKSHGRMYWFTENTKAYKRIRINIDANWSGSYSQIGTIRFYEAVHGMEGQHKYDVALYGSQEKPFVATIAKGASDDGSFRAVDSTVTLNAPLVLDGHKFAEMSRNYIYIVPAATDTGDLPANLNASQATPIPPVAGTEQAAFLYTDIRKIHYGSQADIENECLALLQSRHTVEYSPVPDSYFEQCQGAYDYPLYFTNMKVSTTERTRGAASSYQCRNVTNNWISPNAAITDVFKGKNHHPYNNEFTLEVDFKWEGPTDTEADSYHVLYDNGHYTSRGWALTYHNRKKCFALYWGSPSVNAFTYAVPCNAADGKWHTLSVSQRGNNLFIHVDGKCLGAFDDVSMSNPNYRYWMLGRWIHTNGNPWYGYFNNLRLTMGTCLYQGADYAVTPVFHRSLIPHKTLWYDSTEGVVKEWQADTEYWLKTPMLPIGHVDTGRKEHLLTDQPRGTYHLQQTKYINAYAASSQTDGNYTPAGLFNFGHGGSYPWHSGAGANTTEQWASFTLEEPMAFEALMLCNYALTWTYYTPLFLWQGSKDGENWETLLDRSTFVDDGGFVDSFPKPNGDTHHIGEYKTFFYNNAQTFKHYRLFCPAKGAVPLYNGSNYIAARIMLPFRGARPEVVGISSYVIGDTWTYGPVPLGIGSEVSIPVPFGNLPFAVDGLVEEENDYQLKRRRLGEMSGWYANAHAVQGEIVYQKNDALVLVTGNSSLSLYNGSHYNAPSNSADSTKANYYFIIQRRGV